MAAACGGWGMCLTKLERYEEAETQLAAAYEGLEAALGGDHHLTRSAVQALVDLYEAWGKPDKAAQYRALPPGTEPSSPKEVPHSDAVSRGKD